MRTHGRLDKNHHELAEALRSMGWKFKSTAALGDGFGDGIVQRGYETKIVEFKSARGRLTTQQRKMVDREGWIIYVLRSLEDALNL